MDYRRLGRSGVTVSRLCLGAMMFGDQTDEAESARIVDGARSAGVNFIDTADAYAGGESERIVGRAIAAHRDHWILTTKVGTALPPPDVNRGGLGRGWLLRAAEDSLRRLNTDRIDLYLLHLDDFAAPQEETVAALGDLVRAGKIRYWGVSNFRAWRIAELIRLCDRTGTPRPIAAQPLYNAMNRMAEVEYLPACAHFGIGVAPYSPLARGVLTGKYHAAEEPDAATRAGRRDRRMMQTEFRRESIELAASVRAHAAARGRTAVGLALNWVLANPLIASVVAGPRTEEQWASYLSALDEPYDAEDEAFVSGLAPAGHASTPGYTDPLYPVLGRPASRVG